MSDWSQNLRSCKRATGAPTTSTLEDEVVVNATFCGLGRPYGDWQGVLKSYEGAFYAHITLAS
jgi:hypothetical protein